MSIRSSIHLPEWRSRRTSDGDRAERAWRRQVLEEEADAVRRAADRGTPPARQIVW